MLKLTRCVSRPQSNSSCAINEGMIQVVDTVLAKLFCEDEKTGDLYTLIREPNHIVLPELEPTLIRTGQYNALCIMYKERGDDVKLLDTWSKCVSSHTRIHCCLTSDKVGGWRVVGRRRQRSFVRHN